MLRNCGDRQLTRRINETRTFDSSEYPLDLSPTVLDISDYEIRNNVTYVLIRTKDPSCATEKKSKHKKPCQMTSFIAREGEVLYEIEGIEGVEGITHTSSKAREKPFVLFG